jgi:AraC-like DNA-binding protein
LKVKSGAFRLRPGLVLNRREGRRLGAEDQPLATPSPDIGLLRISTRDVPDSDRTPFWREAWREVFGRQICRLEFEPLSDGPLDINVTLRSLPGLNVGWCLSSMAARWSRTAELVKDGDDTFGLIIPLAAQLNRSQRGQDVIANPGDGVGILTSEPGGIQFRELNDIAVMVSRSALAPLVPDLEEAATRLIPSTNEALRLLKLYLMAWRDNFNITDPALCRLAVEHAHDLIAMALGATREAAAIANARGMRAARLKAVKADIAANLTERDLSVVAVALRQRVTPRYIHMLFDGEGTTFSQFVLAERLARVHRLLLDRRHVHRSIGEIAFASGFGDLSHFNHAFRRHYGATPSEVRRGKA